MGEGKKEKKDYKRGDLVIVDRSFIEIIENTKTQEEHGQLLIQLAEKDRQIFSLKSEIERLNSVIINFKIDQIKAGMDENKKEFNRTMKEIAEKYDIVVSNGSFDTITGEFKVDEDKLETHDSHGKPISHKVRNEDAKNNS